MFSSVWFSSENKKSRGRDFGQWLIGIVSPVSESALFTGEVGFAEISSVSVGM